MADKHSRFSASAAARWMACPGSIVLSAGKPNTSSVYADEGTAAHQLAEWCITQNAEPAAFAGRVITVGEREFTVNDEMIEHVGRHVATVREYAQGADLVECEVTVNYGSWLGVSDDDAFGTADTIILKGSTIVVVDLKYGRGEEVDAVGNPQLQLYALGALARHELAGDFTEAVMVISQPRAGGVREWRTSVADLRAFATQARESAERVLDAVIDYPGAEWHEKYTSASTDACRWCKAKATCPTARDAVTAAVFDTTPATPEEFADCTQPINEPPADTGMDRMQWLAVALSKVDMIEDWCKAVRADAADALQAGQDVPGYKLVRGKRGARAWADAQQAEETLKGFRLKREDMYDFKLISPTSAEKLAKAGTLGERQWKRLQELITQPEGGLHVAPLSDKREAVQVAPVADAFQSVETTDDLA